MKNKTTICLIKKKILNCEAIVSSAFLYNNKAIVAQLARAADL